MRENRERSWRWHEKKLEEWKKNVMNAADILLRQGITKECVWDNCWAKDAPEWYEERALKVLQELHEYFHERIEKGSLPHRALFVLKTSVECSGVVVLKGNLKLPVGRETSEPCRRYEVLKESDLNWLQVRNEENGEVMWVGQK